MSRSDFFRIICAILLQITFLPLTNGATCSLDGMTLDDDGKRADNKGFMAAQVGSTWFFDIAEMGDINNDGFDDMILGSGPTRRIHIIFGSDAYEKPSDVQINDLSFFDGLKGFRLHDPSGYVAYIAIFDADGDGFNDIMWSSTHQHTCDNGVVSCAKLMIFHGKGNITYSPMYTVPSMVQAGNLDFTL